jgi:hypothetical protein
MQFYQSIFMGPEMSRKAVVTRPEISNSTQFDIY